MTNVICKHCGSGNMIKEWKESCGPTKKRVTYRCGDCNELSYYIENVRQPLPYVPFPMGRKRWD